MRMREGETLRGEDAPEPDLVEQTETATESFRVGLGVVAAKAGLAGPGGWAAPSARTIGVAVAAVLTVHSGLLCFFSAATCMMLADAAADWGYVARRPRLVVDLSPQNEWLYNRKFRYETLPAFTAALKAGDHMASWDVSDEFHHIRLAPRECARLAFRVAGVLYFPLTLPFGLKLAPWARTKLLRPVIAHLRSHGYVVMPYMDDFGISVDQPSPLTADEATAARAYAVALFHRLGLHVHPSKGSATGTTRMELLGFVVYTVRQMLILPPERRRKLVGSAHSLLRAAAADRRWVRTRALQRFCGRTASAALAISLAR